MPTGEDRNDRRKPASGAARPASPGSAARSSGEPLPPLHDDAIIEIDLDGTITQWSDRAVDLFGYTAAEMVGQSAARLIPADKLGEPRALLARIAQGDRVINMETTRIAKGGRIIRVAMSYTPVTGIGGGITGMCGRARPAVRRGSAHDFDAHLAAIVDSTDDAIISKRLDGTILTWNPAAERMFGYAAAEMVGRSVTRLFPPERVSEEDLLLTSIARGERVAHFETVRVRKDGTRLPVSVTLSPLRDEAGRIVGAAKIARDISERQRMMAALSEQGERFRVTLRSIADAVIATDARGNVDFINPAAQRLTGWQQAEAVGRPIEQIFHIVREHGGAAAENPVRRCLGELQPVALADQTLLVGRDGTARNIQDSAAPIFDAFGDMRGSVLVFHDISEQRRMASEMMFRSTHDPLTNLLNRAEFESRVELLLREPAGERTDAVLYVDLDQFKLVNDACGHAVGDRLLQQIAELIQRHMAVRDTLARVGGDEFGVIVKGGGPDTAQERSWQICQAVDEFRFAHDGRQFRIGASIGVVSLTGNWASSAAVLQAADAACAAAKEEGRNRVHSWYDVDEAMRVRKGETELITRLTQALEENRLQLYAQRIVCATGDGPPHYEILLRMPDGRGGMISPGSFLPAAERYQIVSRIDRWVVGSVFSWMAANADELRHIGSIAVNLSGQSIGDRAFHRLLGDALSDPGFDAGKLCFEITETAAITHLADATEFMRQLRARGVRIALDDFGAGASYFGYLKAITADLMKIDGQFIQNLVHDPIDQAAVRCFCDIARSAGMQVVAECVETEAVAQMLRTFGVQYLQGYHFHRPEPLERVVAGTRSVT